MMMSWMMTSQKRCESAVTRGTYLWHVAACHLQCGFIMAVV